MDKNIMVDYDASFDELRSASNPPYMLTSQRVGWISRAFYDVIHHFSRHFVTLFFLLFLSSCSHVAKQDGPPNFYVDETKIPNAKPKPERLAKYGNMPSYIVFGKRYYTMKSSKYYQATGTASWYGTKFHKRLTSSGERYNMLAMTAAHKTLPLPTYVEVTNLKNKRKIIVKVNDRGPFESNRLIDLSYVAAKKLGMLGHGTAKVRVTAIDPNTFARAHSPSSYAFYRRKGLGEGGYKKRLLSPTLSSNKKRWRRGSEQLKSYQPVQMVYLQVGAFKNKSNAERLKHRLVALLAAPVNISNPSSKTNLYRVKVGPLKDVAAVERISHRLKGLGIKHNRTHGV